MLKFHSKESDERGVTIVLVALLLTTLLGMAAFAIDLGNARQIARNEQSASDGASLAASQDLPRDLPDSTKALAARNTARSYVASSLNGTASGPACASMGDTCTFTVDGRTVRVTTPYSVTGMEGHEHNLIFVEVCGTASALFSKIWSDEGRRVCRSAVARNIVVDEGVGIGIISLNPSAACSIGINGNNTVTVQGGAVLANSTATPAICGSSASGCGSFTLNAALVAASGTVADCVEAHTNGEVVEDADPLPDPFGSLPDSPCSAPEATTCVAGTPVRPSVNGVCSSAGMTPGYFGSGCNLGGGNGTTQMTPGVYFFNGSFDPRGYDVRCSTCSAANGGVLMYFYSGSLSHTGNGTVNLIPYQATQPAGSVYGGLSIYQRRSNTTPMTLGGTTGSGLGSIYAKGAVVNLHGNVVRAVNGIIVGDSISFNGNTTTTVIPPPGGPTTDPIIDIGLEK